MNVRKGLRKMNNLFKYSSDNKRYHTWNYHLRQKFGEKVFKVSLNGGFTCPNIDGSKGTGGCIYCSDSGSGDFAGNPKEDITEQFYEVRDMISKKWDAAKYIGYFQAHTNTYAPLDVLKSKFEPILALPNVVGLSIATRADCISPETLEYLAEINKRTYLIVELGLQSIFDETGKIINRCHTYADFLEGHRRLTERGIKVCVHIIDGLPGENAEMMIETAKEVGLLHPHCVKIHLLHVIKGTPIEKMLLSGELRFLELEEYVDIVIKQLEVLPEETIIQRVTGDGAHDTLIGPLWSLKKFVVMNEIDKEMVRRNTYQGIKCKQY